MIDPALKHRYFFDFHQSEVIFNADVVLGASVLDEGVEARQVGGEFFVGVDHCDFRGAPMNLASFSKEVPISFGNHEVEILNFSVVSSRGNVEDSRTSVEVEVYSCAFIH